MVSRHPINIEAQWAHGTTAAGYLADLRAAIVASRARLAVYERAGDQVAVTITPTDDVLPPERRGPQSLPNLLVVYSAGHGVIRTGYQFSELAQVAVPPEARWLK